MLALDEEEEEEVVVVVLVQVFLFSSCSRIRWKGETELLLGFDRVSRISEVDERSNVFIWTKGVGDVTKENVFVLVLVWSLEFRIGWAFCNL